ncbi:MAG TPA: hypothetical protein VLW85_11725 [Myxococcales bacterium]|nr:hypothetical protein [Myxococcales bacterium]
MVLLLLAAKVVILPYAALPGVPDAAAARATELLQQDLAARPADVQLLELPPSAPAKPDDALQQARAALGKAAALARKGQHAQSAEQLQSAIALLQSHPALLDEPLGQQMIDAALQLAVERSMAGDEDGGDAALMQLVRLAPERNVEKSDYPPAFLMALSSAKKRQLAEPRGSLRVLAPPGSGDARVTVDGKALRSPPLVVEQLIPGEHFVRVERNGAAWGKRVVVIAGVETKVAPVDDEVAGALLQGEVDRGAVQAAARVARDAGAQAALFGAVVKRGDVVRLRTFLVRDGKLAPLPMLELDRELLGGLVQMVKVGDDVVARLSAQTLDEPPLPLSLSVEPQPVLAQVAVAPPPPQEPVVEKPVARAAPPKLVATPPEPPSRALVVPRQPTPDDDAPVPAKAVQVVARSSAPRAALDPAPMPARAVEPEKKHRTLLWIAAGVLVAGGLATGGYFLYEAGRTPTTATVTTTWGH